MSENKNENKNPKRAQRDMSPEIYLSKIIGNEQLKKIQDSDYFYVSVCSYFFDSKETNAFYENIQKNNLIENNRYICTIFYSISKESFLDVLNSFKFENREINLFLKLVKGYIYLEQKKYDDALNLWESIDISPFQKESVKEYYFLLKGRILLHKKQYSESFKFLGKEVYNYFEENRTYFIACCECHLGNYSNAKVLFEECLTFLKAQDVKDEERIENRKDLIACCEYTLGNYSNAKVLFEEYLTFLNAQEVKNEKLIENRKYWIADYNEKLSKGYKSPKLVFEFEGFFCYGISTGIKVSLKF